MARYAQSIDFILAQVRTLSGPVVGGQVYFYAAGTGTPKTVWLDRGKTTEAAAVAGAAALLGAVLTLLGGVLAWIWNKTDSKIDRIATSLEALTLTTSTELATIKAKCEANHPS